MPGYLRRVADIEIAGALTRRGAVLVEGCRASGKTWSARNAARSEARLDEEGTLLLATADPAMVIEGPVPRLLDEWQNAPHLWNLVRRACDDRAQVGQFILTGSALPQDDATRHTGAGRVSRIVMRPMSLYEMGLSSGAASLRSLMDGTTVAAPRDESVGLGNIASFVCVGGWPGNLGLQDDDARLAVADYLDEVVRLDLPIVAGVRHRPVAVRRLVRSLARHVATEAKIATLVADTGRDTPLARTTVAAYLEALERVFVVEDQPAWAVGLRSRSSLRRVPKRHFVDPSLAASMLGASPARILADPQTFGLLFESLVIRDLRVYGQPLRAGVFHYRDDTGLEVDAIGERDDGAWIAIEVKLSPVRDAVEQGARSLLRLRNKVSARRVGDLAALVVVTSTGPAYPRPDGVQVAPITALGP